MVQPELVLIAVAAVVPPLGLALLAARLPAPAARSRLALVVAFVWGAALATWAAAALNAQGAAVVGALAGAEAARVLVPTGLAPLVEELAKGAGFVAVAAVARPAVATPRSAVATGAVLGLGFAAAENVDYYTLAGVQAGWAGLARAVYLRGVVQAGNHAAFTAALGAGIGWAAARARSRPAAAGAIAAGLAGAVALHALWNAVLSDRITTVLCDPPLPGGACAPAPDALDLLVRVPLLEAVFLGPVLLLLRRIVGRA